MSPPVELSIVITVVVISSIWGALIREAALPFINPGSEIQLLGAADFALYVLGVGSAVALYLRARGLSIRTDIPRSISTGVVSMLTPSAVVLVAISIGLLLSVDVHDLFSSVRYAQMVPLWYYILDHTISATFFGVAYALLICGVVYETLRRYVVVSDRHAAILAVVPVSSIHIFPISTESVGRFVGSSFGNQVPEHLALNVFGIVAAICLSASLGVVYRAYVDRDLWSVFRIRFAPIYAISVVGVGVVVIDIGSFGEELFYAVASVIAVVGYDRTESILVAIVALALFETIVTVIPGLLAM